MTADTGGSAPRSLLARAGWTEGDAWTVGIGLVLAGSLAVTTIPAVLDARGAGGSRPAAAVAAPLPPPVLVPEVPAAPAPPAPAPQPLLGPLVPDLVLPVPALPAPASTPSGPPVLPPAGPAPLAPGAVALFASLADAAAPGAVATTRSGAVHAATDAPAEPGAGPSRLLGFDALGVLTDESDVPDQPDDRTRGITGLTATADGALLAVDAATSRLLRHTTGTWSVLATIPDVPVCLLPADAACQPGLLDTAPLLRGVALGPDGSSYVADAGQGVVWRVQPGGQPEPWYAGADLQGEHGVAGLAHDLDGSLLAVVTRLGGVQATGAGALLRIPVAADGAAGERTVVATFAVGEDPVDVAVGASGRRYVPLHGGNALVVLDEQGVEALRVVDDALQAPTAVDVSTGRVLVTASAPRPAVLAVGVDDRPVPNPSRSLPRG